MKRWQHCTICIRPDGDEEGANRKLTEYGLAGWEMVAAVSAGANYVRFFFKRPADNQVLPAQR